MSEVNRANDAWERFLENHGHDPITSRDVFIVGFAAGKKVGFREAAELVAEMLRQSSKASARQQV